MIRNLVCIAFFCMAITACKVNEIPADFDYGKIENHQYTNSFFKFQINVPDEWVVQSKQQTEELQQKGQDMLAGDNSQMRDAIKASEVNTANLLAVFKYPVGTTVAYNPSFMLVAENIANAPEIKTGADYLTLTRKLLTQAQIKYSHVDKKFGVEKIGNREFHVMNADVELMENSIHQKYYATLVNGFSFVTIISYNNDDQLQELKTILSSAQFD